MTISTQDIQKIQPNLLNGNCEYVAAFVNKHWPESSAEDQIAQARALIDRLNELQALREQEWNDENVSQAVIASGNVNWLFETPRCQVFQKDYDKLIELMDEYRAGVDAQSQSYLSLGGLVEGARLFTGISADQQAKLTAAQEIQQQFIELMVAAPENWQSARLNVTEANQAQLKDGSINVSRLGVVYNQVNSLLELLPQVDSKFDLVFNKLCYDYLCAMKQSSTSDIDIINSESSFLAVKQVFEQLTPSYDPRIDYTPFYEQLIKGFNEVCVKTAETVDDSIATAVDCMAVNVYENPVDALGQIKQWMEHHAPQGLIGPRSSFKGQLKKQCSVDSPVQRPAGMAHDPRIAETGAGKAKINFSTDSDAMADSNVPSLLSWVNHTAELPVGPVFVRMGCQTRTVQGNIEAFPSFVRYAQALERRDAVAAGKTSLLYISNLKSDNSLVDVAGTSEGQRIYALLQAADKVDSLDVVVIPANRSFLHEKQRHDSDVKINMDEFKKELVEIVLHNGQDFYMSDSTREKLFNIYISQSTRQELSRQVLLGKEDQLRRKIVSAWIDEAIHDLYTRGNVPVEISCAVRQQIATHFFKYTFTNKLIKGLNPSRVTTPCKDNIDRGAVHSIYYHIVQKTMQLNTALVNIGEDDRGKLVADFNRYIAQLLYKEVHCAALLVKGRAINENIDLLAHALRGFVNGPHGQQAQANGAMDSLNQWLCQFNAGTEHEHKGPTQDEEDKARTRRKQWRMPTTTNVGAFGTLIDTYLGLVTTASGAYSRIHALGRVAGATISAGASAISSTLSVGASAVGSTLNAGQQLLSLLRQTSLEVVQDDEMTPGTDTHASAENLLANSCHDLSDLLDSESDDRSVADGSDSEPDLCDVDLCDVGGDSDQPVNQTPQYEPISRQEQTDLLVSLVTRAETAKQYGPRQFKVSHASSGRVFRIVGQDGQSAQAELEDEARSKRVMIEAAKRHATPIIVHMTPLVKEAKERELALKNEMDKLRATVEQAGHLVRRPTMQTPAAQQVFQQTQGQGTDGGASAAAASDSAASVVLSISS